MQLEEAMEEDPPEIDGDDEPAPSRSIDAASLRPIQCEVRDWHGGRAFGAVITLVARA